jgi:hypothetical protein
MHEELPLVVAGAAGVDDVVLVTRLERRAHPLVQRVRRLHVVVAVDKGGWRLRAGVQPVAGHDRVAAGVVHLRVLDADAGQLVGHPPGGAPHLVLLVRVGADRLDPEELVKALQVLVPVVAEVGKRSVDAAGGGGHAPIIGAWRSVHRNWHPISQPVAEPTRHLTAVNSPWPVQPRDGSDDAGAGVRGDGTSVPWLYQPPAG